jgi:hypothetical protein
LTLEIENLRYKLSILDKTAFCLEQERRTKELEVQELVGQKERIEKWIAKYSNKDDNEDENDKDFTHLK